MLIVAQFKRNLTYKIYFHMRNKFGLFPSQFPLMENKNLMFDSCYRRSSANYFRDDPVFITDRSQFQVYN